MSRFTRRNLSPSLTWSLQPLLALHKRRSSRKTWTPFFLWIFNPFVAPDHYVSALWAAPFETPFFNIFWLWMEKFPLLDNWYLLYFAFQLIFYNYIAAGCFDMSPVASQSVNIPGNNSLDASSCPDSIKKDIEDLRQQLQSMKKQTITTLEQTRKSSDRE
jgi:hypothetical protein